MQEGSRGSGLELEVAALVADDPWDQERDGLGLARASVRVLSVWVGD